MTASSGGPPPAEAHSSGPLPGLLEEWISAQSDLAAASENTVAAYRRDVSGFIEFLTGHLGGEVRGADLESVGLREMRAWMARERMRGVTPRTLARELSAVKSFFRWAGEKRGFDPVGVLMVKSPKFQRSLPRPLSESAARNAMEFAGKATGEKWVAARDEAVVALMYGCGLRVSEALSLAWRDLPIPDALRVRGKGGKERIVPVIPATREAVRKYAELCPHACEAEEPLFLGSRGGPLNQRTVRKTLEQVRISLGLPQTATPHAMRHSFATHMLKYSGDLRAIQELLGHASLSTTQAYTAVEQSQLRKVYERAHPRAH